MKKPKYQFLLDDKIFLGTEEEFINITDFKWKIWRVDRKVHRENDLPAVVHQNGDKYWYINGRRHRENGPAVECTDGTKYWYRDGESISEEEFLEWKTEIQNQKIVDLLSEKLRLTFENYDKIINSIISMIKSHKITEDLINQFSDNSK